MKKRAKVMDPVGYLGPEERWKLLGVAIVRQAISDWKETIEIIQKQGDAPRDKLEQKNSAERFFLSNTCEFYCDIEGKTILHRLKEDAKRGQVRQSA